MNLYLAGAALCACAGVQHVTGAGPDIPINVWSGGNQMPFHARADLDAAAVNGTAPTNGTASATTAASATPAATAASSGAASAEPASSSPAPETTGGAGLPVQCRTRPVAKADNTVEGYVPYNGQIAFYKWIYATHDGAFYGASKNEQVSCTPNVILADAPIKLGWEVAPFDNYTQLLIELYEFGTPALATADGAYDHQLNLVNKSPYKLVAGRNNAQSIQMTYCPARVLLRTKNTMKTSVDYVEPAYPIDTESFVTFRGRDYAMVDGTQAKQSCNQACDSKVNAFQIPDGWDVALDNVHSRAAVAMGGDSGYNFDYVCKWMAEPSDNTKGNSYSQIPSASCKDTSATVLRSKALNKTIVSRSGCTGITITRPSKPGSADTWKSSFGEPPAASTFTTTESVFAVLDNSKPEEQSNSQSPSQTYPIEIPKGWKVAGPSTPGWDTMVAKKLRWGAGKPASMLNGTQDPEYQVLAYNPPFYTSIKGYMKVVMSKPANGANPCNWEWTEWVCDAAKKLQTRTLRGYDKANPNCPAGMPEKDTDYCMQSTAMPVGPTATAKPSASEPAKAPTPSMATKAATMTTPLVAVLVAFIGALVH